MATNNTLSRGAAARAVAILFAALVVAGCGRNDTRVNSDPGPGKPSRADSGDNTMKPASHATSSSAATSPATGTDSTGRPGDASGGTTGAGSGAAASGATSEQSKQEGRK